MNGDRPMGSKYSPWQTLLEGGLQNWFGQNALELPEGTAEMLGPFADLEEDRRGQLLQVLRAKLGTFPFHKVHPTWLVESLPEEPLLRHWALDSLPPTVRTIVARKAGKARQTRVVPTPPPPWFFDWFQLCLKRRIGNLNPIPWLIQKDEPLTFLASMDGSELLTTLRFFGLRLLASAVVEWSQGEMVVELFKLKDPQRNHVVTLIRDRAIEIPAFWSERFQAMDQNLDRPLMLCLQDLAEQAKYRGQRDHGKRIAYRLDPDYGRILLDYLSESPHEAYSGSENWDANRLEDLEYLQKKEQIQIPNIEEEGFF